MSSQLKPCPHCGDTDLIIYGKGSEKHYVRCHGCDMQGPKIYGREKAAADAWNAIPSRHEITPNSVDCQGCPERRYRSHDHA